VSVFVLSRYWLLILHEAKPKAASLKVLLSLPFTPAEQTITEQYTISPSSELPLRSLAVLQDLLCLRLIQAGQYADAVKLDRRFPPSTTASDVGRQTAEKRRKMLDDVMSLMPSVERQMLEMDLKSETSSGTSLKAAPSLPSILGDLSGIRQHVSASSHSSQSIPQRSHAPRFGGPIPVVSRIGALPATDLPPPTPQNRDNITLAAAAARALRMPAIDQPVESLRSVLCPRTFPIVLIS
jgi:hypothetical protein